MILILTQRAEEERFNLTVGGNLVIDDFDMIS